MNDRGEENQAFLKNGSSSEVSLSAQFQAEVAQTETRPNRSYAVYVLLLLTITYMVNQLDKFSLAVVAKPVAQELHYGNHECAVDKEVKENFLVSNHLTDDQISQWNKLCNE